MREATGHLALAALGTPERESCPGTRPCPGSSCGTAPRRCIKALTSCAATGTSPTISCRTRTPAEIKSWLDAGGLKIVGHQEINGHQALGLRQPWARGYRELWVDSRTFLPLRTIMAGFANTTSPLKNVQLINNETWLPRTTSLLDMVNHVHIPAGFRQVAPPQ